MAQLIAHRACCGTEHDPLNGKLHGYCVVCGVPWPCEYAGTPPTRALGTAQAEGYVLIRKEAIDWLNGESDFECPPDRYFRGEPPRYWWRSVFREKAGLAASPTPPQPEE